MDYYGLLEINRDATDEDIKKAYKKAALRYHPDKVGNTPEAIEKFQNIQKAHTVLADPKSRKLYDQYGAQGLEILQSQLGPFVDLDFASNARAVTRSAAVLASLSIVFFAFLAVRSDEIVTWNWNVVFIPLYLIESFSLISLLQMLFEKDTSEGNDLDRQQEMSKMKFAYGMMLAVVICITVLSVLIACKLDGSVSASWSQILIPWYLIETANFIISCFFLATTLGEPVFEEDTARNRTGIEILGLIFTYFFPLILRYTFMILLVIKLDNPSTFSWIVVFIPTFVWAFSKVISIIILIIRKAWQELPGMIAMYAVSATFIFTFVGLLLRRLTTEDYVTTAVILIPIFIILSFICCCFACCLPLLIAGAEHDLEGQMAAFGNRGVVPVARRIAPTVVTVG